MIFLLQIQGLLLGELDASACFVSTLPHSNVVTFTPYPIFHAVLTQASLQTWLTKCGWWRREKKLGEFLYYYETGKYRLVLTEMQCICSKHCYSTVIAKYKHWCKICLVKIPTCCMIWLCCTEVVEVWLFE